MNEVLAGGQPLPSPLRDARLRFVQRTVLLLLLLAAGATALVGTLHWLQPQSPPLSRIMPPLLTVLFSILAWRHWRQPSRLHSTLWAGWLMLLVALATPSWLFVSQAAAGPQRLIDILPPVGAAFLPMALVITLFAKPRHALIAVLLSWLLIATPILGYLLLHPDELAAPRGLDLLVALGPLSLLVPMLIPWLRGAEHHFHALHKEGERLHALAERDVLIGLYNRRAGERFVATLLAHAQCEAALMLFDIDHFKSINDRYGHPAGDAVLVEVGRRCAAQLGSDDIFARWGGEEFLVVLPGASAETSRAVAEQLRQAIHSPPIAPVGTVSASFGVTSVRPNDTLAELLQRADDALYRAKAAGRNRVECD